MELDISFPKNTKLYLKNPEHSQLGQRIILVSIELIKELGLEDFTFRKLALAIQSNEASIYRYFENKHKLLVYLISFYWEVLDMKIAFSTENLDDPKEKLMRLVQVMVNIEHATPKIKSMDIGGLHEIIVAESAKAFLTKRVELENQEGFFKSYEKLVDTISTIFIQVNPEYEFPRALACNLIETTYEQLYFSKHFESLTEMQSKDGSKRQVKRFLESLILSVLLKSQVN